MVFEENGLRMLLGTDVELRGTPSVEKNSQFVLILKLLGTLLKNVKKN